MGLSDEDAAALGEDGAVRVRTFRLVVVLAQRFRTLMDARLQEEGLTTQQAALITIVDDLDSPTLSQVAARLGSTHQNARQIASALQRKDLLTITPDPDDGRALRLRTTDRSRRLWARRSRDDQRFITEWFGDLDPDEARTLYALLQRVHGNVGGAR